MRFRIATHLATSALAVLAPMTQSTAQAPTQWVIILDTTGSTGGLLPTWRTDMYPKMVSLIESVNPTAKVALAEHRDFPFSPYGGPNDFPYRLVVPLGPISSWATVFQPALDAMTSGGGGDTPESQMTALCLALNGGGLDLNLNGNFSDPGDVDPIDNLINLDPCQETAVILFTAPDNPHDPILEPNYPQPGVPNSQAFGEQDAEDAIDNFFCPSDPAETSLVTFYELIDGPLTEAPGQLEQLAIHSGGMAVSAGSNLSKLRSAVLEILVHAGGCPAAVTRRNSTPANSTTYGSDEMVPGQTWNSRIFLGPSWTHGIAFVGTAPANTALLPHGTLLVDPASLVLIMPVTSKLFGFARFQEPIPNVPGICGTTFYSQGVQLGSSGWAFTNAEDLLVGINPVGS